MKKSRVKIRAQPDLEMCRKKGSELSWAELSWVHFRSSVYRYAEKGREKNLFLQAAEKMEIRWSIYALFLHKYEYITHMFSELTVLCTKIWQSAGQTRPD